jgi:hypothetical protein
MTKPIAERTYNDLVAEFAEKYSYDFDDNVYDEESYQDFKEIFDSAIGKALVQEVAREAVENCNYKKGIFAQEDAVFDPNWWQEFTKEKE